MDFGSAITQALTQAVHAAAQQNPTYRPPPGAPAQRPPFQTSPWQWSAPPSEPVPSWFHGFADSPSPHGVADNPFYQHNIYSEGDHDIGAVMEALQRELLQRSSPMQNPDNDIPGLAASMGIDWRAAQRYRNNMNTT